MIDDEGNDDGQPTYEIVIADGAIPNPQTMIIVKQLLNGDIHAENNNGEMIIIRTDGSIQTFLDGDDKWVRGKVDNFATAWEVIGYHMNMTAGHSMERTRNEPTN